jgi:hypothetical protein
LHPVGGKLDGFENLRIASAPAQVSRQGFTNLVARRSRIRLEQ